MEENFHLQFKFEEYDDFSKIKMILFVYDDGSYDLLAYKNNTFDMIKKGIIEIDNIINILSTVMERNLAKDYTHSIKYGNMQKITFFNKRGGEEYIKTDTVGRKPSVINNLVHMFLSFMYGIYEDFYQ